MKLLIDSDAFCKLSIGDILPEVARLFDAELSECGRLAALPYMLRRGGLREKYGGGACSKMEETALSLPLIGEPPATWIDRFSGVDRIDPGEAQIFAEAAGAALPFVTGDKRALAAAKTVPGFAAATAGRIVLPEAAYIAMCESLGAEEVRRRFERLREHDTVVRTCFSLGNRDPLAGLASYYDGSAADLHPLTLWTPPGE